MDEFLKIVKDFAKAEATKARVTAMILENNVDISKQTSELKLDLVQNFLGAVQNSIDMAKKSLGAIKEFLDMLENIPSPTEDLVREAEEAISDGEHAIRELQNEIANRSQRHLSQERGGRE